MSQEKVLKYKEEKANRKSIMRKQRVARIVRNSVAGVIVVAVLGWVGYSGVTTYIDNMPRKEVTVDYAAVSDYETALTEEKKAEEKTEDKQEDKTEAEEKTE